MINLLVDISMIIAGFAVVFVPCWKKLRHIEGGVSTIWRVVLGSPARDGQPAVPGVMDRLGQQDDALTQIREQIAAISKRRGTE